MILFAILLLISSFVISISLYNAIKKAPVKYLDEEKFIDAIRYEERFSKIFENQKPVDIMQDYSLHKVGSFHPFTNSL